MKFKIIMNNGKEYVIENETLDDMEKLNTMCELIFSNVFLTSKDINGLMFAVNVENISSVEILEY